jgi:integrase/recombinase XerD
MSTSTAKEFISGASYESVSADPKYVAARLIRILVHAINRHKLEYPTLRYIYREAVKRTKMAKPRRAKHLPEIVTTDDIDRFFAVVKDPQFALMVRLMLSTGARVGEISNIRVADINWENSTIRVRGKAQKDRLLVLSPRISEALKLFLHGKRHTHLFENRLGKPFSVRMIENYFRRYKTAAGIERPFAPHDTRRYLFTKLSEHPNGLDVSVRMLVAGHESPAVHAIYQRLGMAGALPQIREALQNLESKNILK